MHGRTLFLLTALALAATPVLAQSPSDITTDTPSGPPGRTAAAPLEKAAVPGGVIYVADLSGVFGTVDPNTGAVTVLGNTATVLFDIAIDPAGVVYGGTWASVLYTINPANGALLTNIGPMGVFINGLACATDGTLYGSGGSQVYTIDTTTGAATALPSPVGGGCGSAGDLGFDPAGNLYLSCGNGTLMKVDTTTGVGTPVGGTGSGVIYGFAYTDRMYALDLVGTVSEVDLTTAALSNTQPLVPLVNPAGAAALPAIGACCTNGPGTESECIVTTRFDCETNHSLYLGDGAECAAAIDCVALVVTMDSMSAQATADGVLVRWTTAMETDTVGFRVLRELPFDGREKKVQVAFELVPSAGHGLQGASYEVRDVAREARSAVAYYIEDIDVFGRVTRHGPIPVERGTRSRGTAERHAGH